MIDLTQNDEQARANRELLESSGVLMINLMAAPGAGVTRLIESTAQHAQAQVGVIEANLAGHSDIPRVEAAGAAAVQIDTGRASHLDARMVARALERFELAKLDLILVESVGDLIRPADWDLGEALRVSVVSVCGSDDVAVKFPLVFAKSDAVVLAKTDLLPHVDFNRDAFYTLLRKVNDTAHTFELSTKTGEGVKLWLSFLERHLKS